MAHGFLKEHAPITNAIAAPVIAVSRLKGILRSSKPQRQIHGHLTDGDQS